MSFSIVYRLFNSRKYSIKPIQYAIQTKNYAGAAAKAPKKLTGKKVAVIEKKTLPVETDVNRLITHVCGTNIYKEGGEDVKLKPDSEYPDWLWTIRICPPPPLEELDPNTKQYWRRLRGFGQKRNNREKKTRKF